MRWLTGLALCLLAAAAFAAPPAPAAGTPGPLASKLEAASRRHLGVKYTLDPLGEGPRGAVDRDPLETWAGVDCLTYVEQCLAETLAPSPRDEEKTLERIRYRGGEVRFEARNHETVADWLPNNRWFARDVTQAIGGAACEVMEKTWDRAAFFRRRGADPAAGGPPERLKTAYVPRASLAALAGRVPDASMVIFVQNRPGIFASHVGLMFASRNGTRVMRHASQTRGRVIEEPFTAFVARCGREVVGAKFVAFHQPSD